MCPTNESAPPLLLLGGTLCDDRVFAPLLSRLQDQRSSVILLRDHATFHSLAHHILANAPPHFALLGFSLGGIVALEIAAIAPDRVLGLALLDSTAGAAPEHTHNARRAALARAQEIGLAHYVREHLWPTYVASHFLANLGLQALLVDMARSEGLATLALQTELALSRADSRDRLASLTMATLVLYGDEDIICPPATQIAMAAALPNATLAAIPGAGHFALLEAPDPVAEHVRSWLGRILLSTHHDADRDSLATSFQQTSGDT